MSKMLGPVGRMVAAKAKGGVVAGGGAAVCFAEVKMEPDCGAAVPGKIVARVGCAGHGGSALVNGVALLAAMLPVVSLYSLFSSFWSICLWWLVVLLLLGVKHVKT